MRPFDKGAAFILTFLLKCDILLKIRPLTLLGGRMEKSNDVIDLEAPRKDGDFVVIVDMKNESVHRSFEEAFRSLYHSICEKTMSGKCSRYIEEASFIERYFIRNGRLSVLPMSLPVAASLAFESGLLSAGGKKLNDVTIPLEMLDRHCERAAIGVLNAACEFFGVGTGRS
jgi:hypothetical protein